jgi:hypothetical protein
MITTKSILISAIFDLRRRVINQAHHAFLSFRRLERAFALVYGMVVSLTPLTSLDSTLTNQPSTPFLRIAQSILTFNIYV